MYDLNLCVPNFQSEKYSDDEKFALLRNYLYELNETLSYALSSLDSANLSPALGARLVQGEKDTAVIKKLDSELKHKFSELKSDIIRAANDVLYECSSELSRTDSEIRAYVGENYTALSEFGDYCSQTSSAINENADAITLNSSRAEEINTQLENYKNEASALLRVSTDAVISETEKTYAKKDELDELSETVSSEIVQSAEDVTAYFTDSISSVREDLSSLGGDVNEIISSLNVYIRSGLLENGDYGIEIGRSDSGIKARFTNEKISFCIGDVEVAYISGTDLYITRAQVLDYLEIGNTDDGFFKFDVTQNGLEVRWSYGN